MICAGCKTIVVDKEPYTSCDCCFKIWCEACKVELRNCPDCNSALCTPYLVAEIDYDEEEYTGNLLCRNCEGVVDEEQAYIGKEIRR